MSKPIIEHSAEAIGRVWTPADHLYLVEQLQKIETLARDLWAYNARDTASKSVWRSRLVLETPDISTRDARRIKR